MGDDGPQQPMQLLTDILFGKAWSRTVPPSAIEIFTAILAEPPQSRDTLDQYLRASNRSPEGLNSSAWEPLHDWTDDELAALDADFGAPEGEPRTALEVKAKEAAERHADLATFERYLTAKNIPVQHTLGALLDLLIACDVVQVHGDGTYSLNPLAPLPSETLPLDPTEAATQDSMRWDRIHEATAQDIIRLFRPDGEELDHLLTDLGQLAAHLQLDPEDARSALQVLLDNGDFTTSIDIATATVQQPFILRVDWDQFNASRISIRFGDSEPE